MRTFIYDGTKQTRTVMIRLFLSCLIILFTISSYSQEGAFSDFLSDPSMINASVSFCVIDSENGSSVSDYNAGKSLVPASLMKLVTTSVALEMLGPAYTFSTSIGYTGLLKRKRGKLSGDIVITGGGDPSLGSKKFTDHYGDFTDLWAGEIKRMGVRKIEGRVITDDSYYDYMPVPAKWLWEDAGNYYGAGAFGLSVFDNTYEIHFRTGQDSVSQIITGIIPAECSFEFSNWLVAAGTSDKGYVFAAPYSTNGWLAGTIPANLDDFVLKASIADPPMIMAKIINKKLSEKGILVSGDPSTVRIQQEEISREINPVSTITSPPLKDIIRVLNHESVNMYAEHLVKELGKVYRNNGSTASGIDVVNEFLLSMGINSGGMFIEDGSGLSPVNAISAAGLVDLLLYMKTKSRYFDDFYASLPEAGKEGTIKNNFRDPLFESRMAAKRGSMSRVKSYAGYLKTISGKELIFSIIVNNFSGPSQRIITHIEDIIRELILYE